MNIEIQTYLPSWPSEFEQISAVLRNSLGGLALRIDHIGSTAVPGLAAKDRIDVQVTVASLDAVAREALSSLGYTHVEHITCDHRPPGASGNPADWSKWFFRPPVNQRPTNLHVRVAGAANQRYALLFRDYLRSHPPQAVAYGELKRRLAASLRDAEHYPDVKDPAVDLIYYAAEAWAAACGWAVGRSDA